MTVNNSAPLLLLDNAPKLAINNKIFLNKAKYISCYHCLNQEIKFVDIKIFVDNGKTGLCPKCGIDSLIGTDDLVDENFLKEIQTKWFWEDAHLDGSKVH